MHVDSIICTEPDQPARLDCFCALFLGQGITHINRLHSFVYEDTVLGLHPTRVMSILRLTGNDLAVGSIPAAYHVLERINQMPPSALYLFVHD